MPSSNTAAAFDHDTVQSEGVDADADTDADVFHDAAADTSSEAPSMEGVNHLLELLGAFAPEDLHANVQPGSIPGLFASLVRWCKLDSSLKATTVSKFDGEK